MRRLLLWQLCPILNLGGGVVRIYGIGGAARFGEGDWKRELSTRGVRYDLMHWVQRGNTAPLSFCTPRAGFNVENTSMKG